MVLDAGFFQVFQDSIWQVPRFFSQDPQALSRWCEFLDGYVSYSLTSQSICLFGGDAPKETVMHHVK